MEFPEKVKKNFVEALSFSYFLQIKTAESAVFTSFST